MMDDYKGETLITQEKKTRRKRRNTRIAFWAISVFLFTACITFAVSDDAKVDFYKRNAEILSNNGIVSGVFRAIGWSILKLTANIADLARGLYDTAFGYVDITTVPAVNDFVEKFKPALIGLVALSIFVLGIILVLKHDKKPNVLINLCYAVLCISCSVWFFQTMNELTITTKTGIDAMATGEGSSLAAYDTLNNGTIDILASYNVNGVAMDENSPGTLLHMGLNEDNISYIDINELIDEDACDKIDHTDGSDIFNYQLAISPVDPNQGYPKKVYDGVLWTSIGNSFYYRYHYDFLQTFMVLLSLIIIYICMAYKCIRVAFELLVGRLFAYLYSAELSGGEKIRKILVFIRDSYILLVVTAVCVKIYGIFMAKVTADLDGLACGFISIFLAFAVIDGPNLVERLLGMDAGLKSSFGRMMAFGGLARAGGRAVTKSVKGAAKASGRVSEGLVKKAASGVSGSTKSAAAAKMMNEKGTMTGGGKEAETSTASGIQNHAASPKDKGEEKGKTASGSPSYMDQDSRRSKSNGHNPDNFMNKRPERGTYTKRNLEHGGESSSMSSQKSSISERKQESRSRFFDEGKRKK